MTTFTEKVEELLVKSLNDVVGNYAQKVAGERVSINIDNPEVKQALTNMLAPTQQALLAAHQAEISRVLELWEGDIERGFIPKCSYCATKRKVVGQTVKGKDAQKNNNLPRNWGYYCQKCYDEGSELEREAMYG